MSNQRNYIKFRVLDGPSDVLYIGITTNFEAEKGRLGALIGSSVNFEKEGVRTTEAAAHHWLHSKLQRYADMHYGKFPVYNHVGDNISTVLQGFNPMLVSIKKVGTVKEATLDLGKKLIIFCGPNNTGKTYISYLVNALFEASDTYAGSEKYKIVKSDNPDDISFTYPLTRDYVLSSRREQIDEVNRTFDKIYGISASQMRELFEEAQVSFVGEDELFWHYIKHRPLDMYAQYLEYTVHITKAEDDTNVHVQIKGAGKMKDKQLFSAYYTIADYVATNAVHFPYCEAMMFPVERNSIYTFSKELSINRNLLIDEIQNGGRRFSPSMIIRKRATRYPLAVRQTLGIAEDMTNLKKQKSEYMEFAEELETKFLKGKIDTGKDGDVRFITEGKILPIHLSASIVKTLSSLTFYLRHLAKPNDLVIIDEPELNLHPDSQIALARLFARMIHSDLRLLISTHSDYIIRELNNLIMISSPKVNVKEVAIKCGYNPDVESLSPSDVGAYLFQKGDDHMVTVKELAVEEDGFEVETIDNVIAQLNKQSEELYMHLKYGN